LSGDVIRAADNVYGGAVNIAARVAAASAAGKTLVSSTVCDLARTSAGATFEDRGEQSLKAREPASLTDANPLVLPPGTRPTPSPPNEDAGSLPAL
jgi:class 3 adenylate cyclase